METVSSKDGTVIAFDQLGEGPALVLVAGASCDRSVDTALAQALGTHFTVLNYDRRGRGDSTDTVPYAVEREIEDLDVLLAAAGGSATVVGLSSGAALAALAAASGLPIGHLVMWEPPFDLDPDGPRRAKEYADQLNAYLAEGRRGDALTHFMRQVGIPEETISGIRQSPYWSVGEGMAPTLAYDAAVLNDGTIPTERYARIGVPTLVLAGGASPRWMRDAGQAAAAAVRDGRFGVLEGQDHNVAGDALAPAVRDFVAS